MAAPIDAASKLQEHTDSSNAFRKESIKILFLWPNQQGRKSCRFGGDAFPSDVTDASYSEYSSSTAPLPTVVFQR